MEKGKIDAKLSRIINDIAREDNNLLTLDLKYGQLGLVIFNFILFKSTGKEWHAEKATSLLEEILDVINAGNITEDIGILLSDLGYVMTVLTEHDFIEIDSTTLFDEFDERLFQNMQQRLRKGNFNVVNRGLAIAYYFLARQKQHPHVSRYLEALPGLLMEISFEDEEGLYYWKALPYDEKSIQLGHLHGMGAILIFFSKLITLGICKDTCTALTGNIIRFISKHRNPLPDRSYISAGCRTSCYPCTIRVCLW